MKIDLNLEGINAAMRHMGRTGASTRWDEDRETGSPQDVSGQIRPLLDGEVDPRIANNLNLKLQFSIEQGTGKTVIRIVDGESGKVIRQVPPEELLRVMKVLRDLKGSLVNQRL